MSAILTAITLTALSLAGHLDQASGKRADVYGTGEVYCGNIGYPKPCSKGAVTASGAVFDPNVPSIALSLPRSFKVRPTLIWLKTKQSPCTPIWLTDKKNWKHSAGRPWDVSPAASNLLKFKGTRGYLYLCKEMK